MRMPAAMMALMVLSVPLAIPALARAGGVCVRAEGGHHDFCDFGKARFGEGPDCSGTTPPEESYPVSGTDEERAAYDARQQERRQQALKEDQANDALGARARRLANVICDNDADFVSSVKVFAYKDSTHIEIETLQGQMLAFESLARKLVLAFGSVPVRENDPVLLMVLPVRMGDVEPILVAVIRTGETGKKTVEFLEHPAWSPEPKTKRKARAK